MSANFPLDPIESQSCAELMCEALRLAASEGVLRQWAEANKEALARLAEEDLQSVRAAYRAKRDELTGART